MRSTTPSESGCAKSPQHPTEYERPFWRLKEDSFVDDDAIRCDACPVLCYIKPGRTGSCDRYGNHEGKLVRLDPHIVLDRALERGGSVVPFLERAGEWDGTLIHQREAGE